MKINCTKCGKLVAYVEKPSRIQSGASIYGACYECKSEGLHNGTLADKLGDYMATFEKIFGSSKPWPKSLGTALGR